MDHPQNRPYYGSDVLMVGIGATPVMYYRVLLPAHALGVDYVGVDGEPPRLAYRTGLAGGTSVMPDMRDYKLVVLQGVRGIGWAQVIRELRAQGTVVVYEVDDYLHGIKDAPDHGFREHFTDRDLREYERCMKLCDAMIVSTPVLAGRYRRFCPRIFVCENGIDLARYDLTRPGRMTVNIGWAGATGHAKAIEPWLRAIGDVMRVRPHVNFVSIGQPFAKALHPYFGQRRATAVPFCAVEQYPSAMTMIDVAIAPGGDGDWQRAKSDLRWLEAAALGIPIVAHPDIYPHIEHGITGFHARTAQDAAPFLAELVDDPGLRIMVGENARMNVRAHRNITVMARAWQRAFAELLSLDPQDAKRLALGR